MITKKTWLFCICTAGWNTLDSGIIAKMEGEVVEKIYSIGPTCMGKGVKSKNEEALIVFGISDVPSHTHRPITFSL